MKRKQKISVLPFPGLHQLVPVRYVERLPGLGVEAEPVDVHEVGVARGAAHRVHVSPVHRDRLPVQGLGVLGLDVALGVEVKGGGRVQDIPGSENCLECDFNVKITWKLLLPHVNVQ